MRGTLRRRNKVLGSYLDKLELFDNLYTDEGSMLFYHLEQV